MLQQEHVKTEIKFRPPVSLSALSVDASATAITQHIKKIAGECLIACHQDAREADTLFQARIREDTVIRDFVFESAIGAFSWKIITNLVHIERGRVYMTPGTDNGQRDYRVHQLSKANERLLMDFPLPIAGLPTLGRATPNQVLEAANYYLTQSKEMGGRGQWLKKVYDARTSDTKPIAKQLKESQLRQLQNEVTKN